MFGRLVRGLCTTANVRVRYAPSPTGMTHLGGLRTALFNYLFARRMGGKFLLRIEDTDRTREVSGAIDELLTTLNWVGLDFDEGPGKENSMFAPYIQSQRYQTYKKYAQILVDNGSAYRCFCSTDRLDEMRQKYASKGMVFKYDRFCLSLKPSEIEDKLQRGEKYTIRLKMPDERIEFEDKIRGVVQFAPSGQEDAILLKSDGFPTYHLANVVDDHLMQISHVIRGEEWLPSVPKHIAIYRGFQWSLPAFAHLPLLFNPDGSKLSKRQGHASVKHYREQGYLPEAMINFVTFLGWGPGDGREIMSMDEIINAFSLERVNKSGAVVNLDKLRWLNAHYMRTLPEKRSIEMLTGFLKERKPDTEFSQAYIEKVFHVIKERVSMPLEIVELCMYFFEDPPLDNEEAKKKMIFPGAASVIDHLKTQLENHDDKEELTEAVVDAMIHRIGEELQLKNKVVLGSIRFALTGTNIGAGIAATLVALGKQTSLRRLTHAHNLLQ